MSAILASPLDSGPTIQRCPHDRENPYTMIHNGLIRDEVLSPDCRWLLIYLLSNTGNWVINVSQIINHLKPHMAKQKVYNIVNEAIESGYMKREIIREDNKIKCVKYYVAETPKFKKCLLLPGFQEQEIQDPEKEDNKKDQNSKEKTSLKESSSKPSSTQPTEKPEDVEPLIDDVCDADDLDKSFSSSNSGATDSSDIVVNRTNGQELRVSQSQVFQFFLQYPQYTTQEIQEAMRRFREIEGPKNNVLKYLVSICETIKKEALRPKKKNDKTKTPKPDYTNLYPEPVPHKNLVRMGDLMKMTEEELEQFKKKNGIK